MVSYTIVAAEETLNLALDTTFPLSYNHGHNIMGIFDVLPNFPFTTSEMEPHY